MFLVVNQFVPHKDLNKTNAGDETKGGRRYLKGRVADLATLPQQKVFPIIHSEPLLLMYNQVYALFSAAD